MIKIKITEGWYVLLLIVVFIALEYFFIGSLGSISNICNKLEAKGESTGYYPALAVLCLVAAVATLFFGALELFSRDLFDSLCSYYGSTSYKDTYILIKINKMTLKKVLWYFAAFIAAIVLFTTISNTYSGIVKVYNTSAIYQNKYKQKEFERKSFYDKLWKVYSQKTDVAIQNKETFLQVTKLIMDGRADGKNVAWKWLHENQNIPYDQFSAFYADLSSYIEQQRNEYFKLEKETQDIANANNVLLDTFPNVIYNKFLNREKIKYEFGFTSDKTDNVFASKKENL